MLTYAWIAFVLLAVIALCAVAYVAYASDIAIAHARHEAHERSALNAATGIINQTLQAINRDLLYLSREGLLEQAINTPSAYAENALASEWLAFSRSKLIYDKIRWIDETGRERLRINHTLLGPQRVEIEKLQDRSLRYFFKDTIQLQPMEIYVSPFDLNVEGESIELPYKPTIRIGTPLFDRRGNRRGVLLLNYTGSDLFARIAQTMPETCNHFWLLNSSGYWLYNQQPEEAWGFMFERADLSLAARHPTVWARILAQRSGQFLTNEGLWTFDTVYPLMEGQKTSSGSARLFSPSQDSHMAQQYFWKAVTLLPLGRYHATSDQDGNLLHGLGRNLFRLYRNLQQLRMGMRDKRELLARDALAAQVVEHTAEGVMVTDAAVRIQMINGAFSRITGYSASETIGRTPFFLQSGDHPTEFYQTLWAQVIKDQSWQGEVWCRRKSGELFAEWLNISTLRGPSGLVTHYICLFSDITRLKESEQRMEYFAHHDTLTGLANSRLLEARMEHSIQLAQRSNRQFALLFIDLDNFKAVNDRFGHSAGDEMLKDVARRLSRCLRNEDTLARLGGDEFVVLLENIRDMEDVQRVADQVLAQFPCSVSAGGEVIEVTASIGISFYPQHGNTPARLLGKADHAMYEAKRQGRNRASCSEPS